MSKQIKTKIQLRYDTLTNWLKTSVANAGGNYVPLKGEMCIAQIDTETEGTTLKPVMFKVGDGTSKFSELAWGSAKAADVYSWAKKSGLPVVSEGNGLFITGISWDSTNNRLKITTSNRIYTDTQQSSFIQVGDGIYINDGVEMDGNFYLGGTFTTPSTIQKDGGQPLSLPDGTEGGTNVIALTSDIPTALKNPNAIKFKNSSGTNVSYDGSSAVDLSGGVYSATRATQDGNGYVISSTYGQLTGDNRWSGSNVFKNGGSVVVEDDNLLKSTTYGLSSIKLDNDDAHTSYNLNFPTLTSNETIATQTYVSDAISGITGYAKLASLNTFTGANEFKNNVSFEGSSSQIEFANTSTGADDYDIRFSSSHVLVRDDSHFYFVDGIWTGGDKGTSGLTNYTNTAIIRNAENASDEKYTINLPSSAGTLALKEDFADSTTSPLKKFTVGIGDDVVQYNGSDTGAFKVEMENTSTSAVTLNQPGGAAKTVVQFMVNKDSSSAKNYYPVKLQLPAADSAVSTTSTNYVSGSAVKTYVDERIADLTGFSIEVPWTAANYASTTAPTAAVLAKVPAVTVYYNNGASTATGTLAATTASTKEHIYLIYHPHDGKDNFDEYVSTGSEWEKIGNTDIDLSNYARTDASNEFISAQNFGTINAYAVDPRGDASHDLGGSSERWRNLYLSGNLSDGTNTVTVADIAKKSDLKSKGSATQPVYFDANGAAQPITYTINKSVPSDAVFTDTKNTAGATNTTTDGAFYIIGASSQGANPTTYSNSDIYFNPADGKIVAKAFSAKATTTSGTQYTTSIAAHGSIDFTIGNVTFTAQLPPESGTLALTSDIPTEANIKSIIETYPGVNKTGTVTSVAADSTYLTGGTITTSGTIGVNTSKFILNDDSEIVILNGGSSTEVI